MIKYAYISLSDITGYRTHKLIRPYITTCSSLIITCFIFLSLIDANLALAKNHQTTAESTSEQAIRKVELDEKERAWLKAHPKIVLGIDSSWDPLVRIGPDGKLSGIDVEFLSLLNKKLGIDIQLRTGSWKDMVEKAKAHEIDGLTASATVKERQAHFLFSSPYIEWHKSVFVRADSSLRVNGLRDLRGRKVGIQQGNIFIRNMLVPIRDVEIVEYPTERDAHKGLLLREIDASIGTPAPTRIANLGFDVQVAYFIDEHPLPLVYSVRKDWPELVEILNKGLHSITEQERGDILKKYVMINSGEKQEVLDLSTEEQTWLAQNHTVRVRVADFPPYFFIDKDEITGMAVEYFNIISQRSGVKFELVIETRPFIEAIQSLMDLKGPDLITSVSPMAERKPHMGFSDPYIVSPRMIFARTGAGFISSIDNLDGKTLAVPRGTLVQKKMAAEFPGVELLLYASDAEAIKAVSTGVADAYIGNLINSSYLILQRGFANVSVAAPCPFSDDVYTFGIRRDWPELKSIINKSLATMTPAEKATIQSKYMSLRYEHGITPADVLKWGIMVSGSVVFIILIFVGWNILLNRKVRVRTFELSESEERFRSTFDQAAVGIAHVSTKDHFLRINQKFCDIVGYSHEEMLSLTFQDITHPDDLDADLKHLERLLLGETDTYSMEKRYLCKDGEIVWVTLTVSLIKKENGEPDGFVAVVEDITERKQAEDNLNKMRYFTDQLIQTADIMIIGLDNNGQITHFNPAAEKITDYKRSEIEGKDWFNLFTPKDKYPDVHEEFNRLLKGGLPKRFENPILTKSGEERFVSWTNSEIKHGEDIVGIISFGLDITENKQAEKKLQQYQQRLKDLASQLIITEEKERRSIAADLHDNVGHSLALARMQLQEALAAQSNVERKVLIKDISNILLQAIQDTRSLIFELSSPSMNEIGLGAAISEWLEDQINRRHGLITEFVDNVADKDRKLLNENVRALLFRNVRELLANVVKHARATRVSVSLSHENKYVKMVVADDGIGFDPIQMASTAQSKKSFGLFSIQERMMDLGGMIDIQSEPHKGCRVTLTMPTGKIRRRESDLMI